MNNTDYKSIKTWFKHYIRILKSRSPLNSKKIKWKALHSVRVSKIIKKLCRSLNMRGKEILIAESAGLLHDIGKIKQYSEDASNKSGHGSYGKKILEENNILKNVIKTGETKNYILNAVEFHNKLVTPDNITNKDLTYLKLVRDADKIDLLYVITEGYSKNNFQKQWTPDTALPDTKGISENVYKSIMNKEVINSSNIKNLNDKKCSFLSWIFDVNYKMSFRMIYKRNFVEKIFKVLPKTEEFKNIFNKIRMFLINHLKKADK